MKLERSLVTSTESNSYTSFNIKTLFSLLHRYEECKRDSPIAFFHCQLRHVDKLYVKEEVKATQ